MVARVAVVDVRQAPEQPAVQGSGKEWSLGCVKRAPVARGDQDVGITQPRDLYKGKVGM